MILIISTITLGIGIVLWLTGWYQPAGLVLTVFSVGFGFFMAGITIPVKTINTEITPLKIQKNEMGTTIYYIDKDGYYPDKVQTIYTSDIRIANSTNVLYITKRVKYNSYNLDANTQYILSEK